MNASIRLSSIPFEGKNQKYLLLTIGIAFIACIAAVSGCNSRAPTTPSDVFKFGKGFYNEEKTSEGSFRWMSDEGIVRLRNNNKNSQIIIVGRLPLGKFSDPPSMTIRFNGKVLEEFKAPTGKFRKEYSITPDQQGADDWSELRISSSATIVPKVVDPNSKDGRKLGFKLHDLNWNASN